MTKIPALLLALLAAWVATLAPAAVAQGVEDVVITELKQVLTNAVSSKVNYQLGNLQYDFNNSIAIGTNGVYINYHQGEAVLTADTVTFNYTNYEVEAEGDVRIESGGMIWVGEHIRYNFKTFVMTSDEFRTGRLPVFVAGAGLTGHIDPSNTASNVITAKNTYVTTDDYDEPVYQVRASTIRIIPGESVQMWNAVAYVEGVPVFYFPYYERSLRRHSNNFTTTPGYRSRYGAYLLNTYNWYLGDAADGKIHLDYRLRRGPGLGPDVNIHAGQWGEATIKYYYLYDKQPNFSTNVFPQYGNIPHNRQRFYLAYQATPATNLDLKAQVNYQSDPLFLHDFFEGDYTMNPQPNTFLEADKYWDNWSLDGLATPRVNSFFSQVERLPDVKLNGLTQQIPGTPLYYNSESSVGWYRAWDANATNGLYPGTNGVNVYEATRADTYHQITVPWTFMNWLNVTPRVGGRLTYYSSQNYTNGLASSQVLRGVFNSGVEVSFKASQLWANATNSLLQVDGLRHIIEPSANYVFIPDPSTPPAQLPQFDSALPSLLPLPITFPDYNDIDSIDAMNTVRFGLRNILQTKRGGELQDLLNWNVFADWRLDGPRNANNFDDVYSQLSFRPRTWLTFESQVRFDLESDNLDLAFHQITIAPNDRWSWGISHWYLRGGFVGPNENNFVASTFYYRLDDNWGFRMAHTFNLQSGVLQEQSYTIFRDLRSWTTAVTFRAEANSGFPTDFTVAFSLSLKANPATHVGEDALSSYHLVGE